MRKGKNPLVISGLLASVVFTVWEPLRCRVRPGASPAPAWRKHPPPLPPEPAPGLGTAIFAYPGSSWGL